MESRRIRVTVACLALLTITLAATIRNSDRAAALTSPYGRGNQFSFRDDFNYNNLTAFQAAGWDLCFGSPPSVTIVGNGVLNLTNDGSQGDIVCYSNIPPRVNSWTVSASGRWIGGYYGSIEIVVTTADHTYRWDADGYFNQFILLRDDVIVFRTNGYTPQLNSWHLLRMDGNSKTGLTMSFDGQQIATFADTIGTSYTMKSVSVMAGWESMTSWDWITAASAQRH